MSVVIAHTAAPPYLRETARVLHEADMLRLAVIGLATRDDDLWMRAISSIPGLGKLHALFRRKRFEEVPRAKLRRRGRYELARLVCGRLDRSGIATDYLWDQGTKRFDRYSASVLRPGDTAYGYEYGCLAFFEQARNLGNTTVYEIPSAAHDWYHDLLNRELSAFPDLMTPWHHRTERLRSERSARRAAELALADHVVVYSSHVIDSYRSLGVDVSRFHAIPLGSPPISAHSLSTSAPQGPIRLVFAGTFGIRKGAHYLIQALESLPKGRFHLDIYGSFALSDSWRARTAAVADWKGPVSFDVLQQAIRNADALILPSLSEAFGMVVTEALAQGTPVIVSEAVGAADLIEPGRSGFMVQSASTQSIVDCLMRLDASRAHWADYRQHARSAASRWQWRDHGNALVNLMGSVARP